MIVRISILDTIINLYKPRIQGNCIRFVSNIQFLTFCDRAKIKKELSIIDLALSLCCLGRIRTLTGGTRIRRATITPQGRVARGCFPFASAKLGTIFELTNFFEIFFEKNVLLPSTRR